MHRLLFKICCLMYVHCFLIFHHGFNVFYTIKNWDVWNIHILHTQNIIIHGPNCSNHGNSTDSTRPTTQFRGVFQRSPLIKNSKAPTIPESSCEVFFLNGCQIQFVISSTYHVLHFLHHLHHLTIYINFIRISPIIYIINRTPFT